MSREDRRDQIRQREDRITSRAYFEWTKVASRQTMQCIEHLSRALPALARTNGRYDVEPIMDHLARTVRSGRPDEQILSIRAIGEMGNAAERLAPDLIPIIDCPTTALGTRLTAIHALGRIVARDRDLAMPALVRQIEGDSWILACGAIEALFTIGWSDNSTVLELLRSHVQVADWTVKRVLIPALLRMGGIARENVVQIVLGGLASHDPAANSAAAAILRETYSRSDPIIDVLVEQLKPCQPPAVRLAAARGIAEIGSAAAESVPALVVCLDGQSDIQIGACKALERIGSGAAAIENGAAGHLIQLVRSDNDDVCCAAIEALGKYGTFASDAGPDLAQLLIRGGARWRVRAAAATALGLISERGDEQTLAILLGLLAGRPSLDDRVRSSVVEALSRVGATDSRVPPAIAPTLQSGATRWAAIQALGRMDDAAARRALPYLMEGRKDSQPAEVRTATDEEIHAWQSDFGRRFFMDGDTPEMLSVGELSRGVRPDQRTSSRQRSAQALRNRVSRLVEARLATMGEVALSGLESALDRGDKVEL